MDPKLQDLWNKIKDHERLDESEKEVYLLALTEFTKNKSAVQFKLDRTEKDKMTLSIMLQESIDDLQKKTKAIGEINATLQNKNHELEIETSLERVRSSAMAMKDRADMLEICRTISTQLELLGVKEIRNVQTAIFHESKGTYTNYEFYARHDKSLITEVNYQDHFVGTSFAEQMLKGPNEVYTFTFVGEQVAEWYKYQKTTNVFIDHYLENATSLNYYWYSLGPVAMGISTYSPLSLEETNLFIRFRNVFELAYRRYLDIEKAETQVREATTEVALERVRTRTLAMQRSDELAETAAVLFKQLIGLGIAPNRLYIGLIREDNNQIEFWITDEDGSRVSTMFSGDASRNDSMKKMYAGWKRQDKSLTIDMQGKELADYFHYLGEELHVPFKDGLSQKRRIQSIAYFSKGFIGMASPDPQPPETLTLIERFAQAFNLTFTRFNDLMVAEAHAQQAAEDLIKLQTEKKRAEDALTELKATQTQLVQSEKMASLGELTAGIAHEIQNPLNFVNNFSEVSSELISEMVEEVSKGHREEARALAEDVRQNLEKILHHGKRADAIVKGMLQHSRTSSGQKELTDINALCDEYLRLAYHGLRAKEKSFNALFETDFDQSIGKINIVPQDIGRVLLNLINNAFYAVNQKQKTEPAGYQPTVRIITKLSKAPSGVGEVSITVSDNANGIPIKILDKIFQPFFTTKPTGEGTGLGLSLSYDIAKAHGGDIKVVTKEGSFSNMTIYLPITT